MALQDNFANQIAVMALDTLPNDYQYRPKEPRYWAVEQVLWACWAAFADHLLDGPPLPNSVQLGADGPSVLVATEMWAQFKSEIGLDTSDEMRRARALLGWQFGSRPIGDAFEFDIDRELPPELCGLIVILCYFEQVRALNGERCFSFTPKTVITTVLQHPQPVAFGPVDELVVFRTLRNYAPFSSKSSSAALRIAFSFGYEPLCERLRMRRTIAAPKLTAGLLTKARTTDATSESPQRSDCPKNEERPASLLMFDRVVRELLDALLRENVAIKMPLLNAARQTLCNSFERFLQQDGVELIGVPGATITLELPHPAWRLDHGYSQPPSDFGEDTMYRVQRSGIKIYDNVILPALVVPTRRNHV